MATQTVGSNTRNGQAAGFGASIRLGWPTERWVGVIVVMALALLILIRLGFRGVGLQGSARVTV